MAVAAAPTPSTTFAKIDGVSIRPNRRMFDADSTHIGGKEDLGIAELSLNSRVSLGALSDLVQRSVMERRCKVTGRRNEPVVREKSPVLRRRQLGRRVRLDRFERRGGDLRESLAKDRNRKLKSSFSEHPGERVQGDFGVAGHSGCPGRLAG